MSEADNDSGAQARSERHAADGQAAPGQLHGCAVELGEAAEGRCGGTPKYECYFFIADYHALTTDYADTSSCRQHAARSRWIFWRRGSIRSRARSSCRAQVPAHFALNALLEMITPLSWLERVPTYKDQQEQLKEKDLATLWVSGVSAAAVGGHPGVPAGLCAGRQDQAAHVEITREIARRFNHLYGPRACEQAKAQREVRQGAAGRAGAGDATSARFCRSRRCC